MQVSQYLERPTKEAIRELPKFNGLSLEKIHLIQTTDSISFAQTEILKSSHIGFDTESKPNFIANQPRTGPHLLQISTLHRSFLFRPDHKPSNELLAEIIQSEKIIKVGFGLKSDRGPIQSKLGVKLRSTIELSIAVKRIGYQQKVGLQTAVAIVLGEYLGKSKKITTSNWAASRLSVPQIIYASNDSFASLRIYLELSRKHPHLLRMA